MNVNNLKPTRHDKAMSMWRGAGILMGNLVVITCIYSVLLQMFPRYWMFLCMKMHENGYFSGIFFFLFQDFFA